MHPSDDDNADFVSEGSTLLQSYTSSGLQFQMREVPPPVASARQPQKPSWLYFVFDKLCALLYLCLGYGLIRYSRLVEVLATPFNLNFECAVLGVLFLSIFIVIGVYMTFGVSHDRWQIDHPNAIPTGTLFAVLGIIFSIIAIWPYYSFLSPFLVFALLLIALNVLPLFSWGSVGYSVNDQKME